MNEWIRGFDDVSDSVVLLRLTGKMSSLNFYRSKKNLDFDESELKSRCFILSSFFNYFMSPVLLFRHTGFNPGCFWSLKHVSNLKAGLLCDTLEQLYKFLTVQSCRFVSEPKYFFLWLLWRGWSSGERSFTCGSLSREINVSGSQLADAAGPRCLGTIRKGVCNLQYHGGGGAGGETLEVICMGWRVGEIARVHHLELAWCSGDGKMRGKLFAV